MPEGQFSGKRGYFLYTSDVGNQYVLQLDATLGALAGTGLVAVTDQNIGGANSPPKRFKPRGVHWQGALGGRVVRKFLVCNGGSDATLFIAGFSVGLTIDGVAGVTTGRRGEVQSYYNIPTQVAPAT